MSADKKSADEMSYDYKSNCGPGLSCSKNDAFKAGFQARDAELLICPACGTEGYRQDIKPCSDSIRVDLKLMGDKIKLLTDALAIAEESLKNISAEVFEPELSSKGLLISAYTSRLRVAKEALYQISKLRKEMEGG